MLTACVFVTQDTARHPRRFVFGKFVRKSNCSRYEVFVNRGLTVYHKSCVLTTLPPSHNKKMFGHPRTKQQFKRFMNYSLFICIMKKHRKGWITLQFGSVVFMISLGALLCSMNAHFLYDGAQCCHLLTTF